MPLTMEAILAAHAAGVSPTQTIEQVYARIAGYNDPAMFISLRPASEAIGIAKALEAEAPRTNRSTACPSR